MPMPINTQSNSSAHINRAHINAWHEYIPNRFSGGLHVRNDTMRGGGASRPADAATGSLLSKTLSPKRIQNPDNRASYLSGVVAHQQQVCQSDKAGQIRASEKSKVYADVFYDTQVLAFARDPEVESARAVLGTMGVPEDVIARLIENRQEGGAQTVLNACAVLVALDVHTYAKPLGDADAGWPMLSADNAAQVDKLETLILSALRKMDEKKNWSDIASNSIGPSHRYAALNALKEGQREVVTTIGLETVRDGLGRMMAPSVNEVLCNKYECGAVEAFDHLDEALGVKVAAMWTGRLEAAAAKANGGTEWVTEFLQLPSLLREAPEPAKKDSKPEAPAEAPRHRGPGPDVLREAVRGKGQFQYSEGNCIHVAAPDLTPVTEMMAKFLDVIKDLLDRQQALQGPAGMSAYELAMKHWKPEQGDKPTEAQWIEGLAGVNGVDGRNAYQVWADAQEPDADKSFNAYLESTKGEKGEKGEKADKFSTIEVVERPLPLKITPTPAVFASCVYLSHARRTSDRGAMVPRRLLTLSLLAQDPDRLQPHPPRHVALVRAHVGPSRRQHPLRAPLRLLPLLPLPRPPHQLAPLGRRRTRSTARRLHPRDQEQRPVAPR